MAAFHNAWCVLCNLSQHSFHWYLGVHKYLCLYCKPFFIILKWFNIDGSEILYHRHCHILLYWDAKLNWTSVAFTQYCIPVCFDLLHRLRHKSNAVLSTWRVVWHTMAASMMLMTGRGDLELVFGVTAQLFNYCCICYLHHIVTMTCHETLYCFRKVQ